MVKMTALYKRPADVEAFLNHYHNVHMPIVRRLPGVKKVEISSMFTFKGDPADPFIMADVYFEDKAQLIAALKSDPGRESGRDAQEFAGEYVQVFFSDVVTEEF